MAASTTIEPPPIIHIKMPATSRAVTMADISLVVAVADDDVFKVVLNFPILKFQLAIATKIH